MTSATDTVSNAVDLVAKSLSQFAQEKVTELYCTLLLCSLYKVFMPYHVIIINPYHIK